MTNRLYSKPIFRLLLKITGGVILFGIVVVAGIYLYFIISISLVDSRPNEALLDKASIAQPHYFDVSGAGTVRLSVSAEWVSEGWGGYGWRYTTQVDYRDAESEPWIKIATKKSSNYPLIYSDQYFIANQVLITNIRRSKDTPFAHDLSEFYLWSKRYGVQKFSIALRNPRTLSFLSREENPDWEQYSLVNRPEATEHEIAVWSKLVKHMEMDEICWYAFDAAPLKFTYQPEQGLLEVIHLIGQTRRLTFKFDQPGRFPELI